jgi:Tol biopolymer transport system component
MTAGPRRIVDDGELDRRLRLTFRTIMPMLDTEPPSNSTDQADATPLVMLDLFARRRPKPSRFTVVAMAAAAVIVAGTVALFALNNRDNRVTTASGPAPGDTRIVYTRFIDTRFSGARLVIADSDGHNAKELTNTSSGSVDRVARISPDGKLIVFYRDHGTATIHVVGSDGEDEHQVDLGCVDPCIEDKFPSFTPDGQHIVFQRIIGPRDPDTGDPVSAVLWEADLDGSNIRRLSEPGIDGTYSDKDASFAPDGYVVFIRTREVDNHPRAVFRMNPDGTDVRQLSPWQAGSLNATARVSPAQSGPTRDLVVFDYQPLAKTVSVIATVPATCRSDAECTAATKFLTSDPSTATTQTSFNNPAWSPDGRRIVFLVDDQPVTPTSDFDLKGAIWTMNWDGKDRKVVADTPVMEQEPTWGPAPGRS